MIQLNSRRNEENIEIIFDSLKLVFRFPTSYLL